MNKDKIIQVRVSEEELAGLKSKAGNMTMSKYILKTVLENEDKQPETADASNCSTCTYGWLFQLVNGMTVIRCKRNAPLPTPIDGNVYANWPMTHFADWCGEWQPKGAL